MHQILLNHPVCVEERGVEGDALLHDVHPRIALFVEARRDEMLECPIQIGGICH